MQSRNAGWKRLGVALTVVWVLAISGLAAYEWFAVPTSPYFVHSVIEKTGEPASLLSGEFADLVPIARAFHTQRFLTILLLPLSALWLFGGLCLWVSAGFRASEP